MGLWMVLSGLLARLAQAASVADVCILLPQVEAEALLGKGSEAIHDSNECRGFCAYQLPKPTASGLVRVQLDLYVSPLKLGSQTLDGKATFAQDLNFLKQTMPAAGRMVSDLKSTPLSELGDQALGFQNTPSIKAKAYNTGILIRKGNPGLAAQMAGLETLQPLAQRARSRLR